MQVGAEPHAVTAARSAELRLKLAQRSTTEPAFGVAVKVMLWPTRNGDPLQVPLVQSTPAGLLVTRPEPAPSIVTDTGSENSALTVISVVPTVNRHTASVVHPGTPLQE